MTYQNFSIPRHKRLYARIADMVRDFVHWWREFDAFTNAPLPSGRRLIWTLIAPDNYPWFVPTLFAVLMTAMALGPTFRHLVPLNYALLGGSVIATLALHEWARRNPTVNQFLLVGQLAIFALVSLILLCAALPETYGTRDTAVHLHVGVAVTVAMIASLVAAWFSARFLFTARHGNALTPALTLTELFPPRDRYDYGGRETNPTILAAIVAVPARYPLQLLLPAALATLYAKADYLQEIFIAFLVVVWLLLFLGILFARLMEILNTLGRLFFIGPQRLISALVVLVAVLRLRDVTYITYLFDTGEAGYGNGTLVIYITLAYATAWYYALWSDQFVARRLMRLIAPHIEAITPIAVPYPFSGVTTFSKVAPDGRTLSMHGAGRIKIEGKYLTEFGGGRALQFLTPYEVFSAIRDALEHQPITARTTPQAHHPLLPLMHHLQRGAFVYPVLIGVYIYTALGGPGVWSFYSAAQPPELVIEAGDAAQLDLTALLKGEPVKGQGVAAGACPVPGPTDPRIAIAASGGGTRAAIYTTSLLYGLAKAGQICNVVLISSVSGGSVALGYFAAHESDLRKPVPDETAWDKFFQTASHDYIDDVIDGISDMRTTYGRFSWQAKTCGELKPNETPQATSIGFPARTRFGTLLAENFVCRFGPQQAATLKDLDFGVLFNTSIIGTFDSKHSMCAGDPLPKAAVRCSQETTKEDAGGRLVLTNLKPLTKPPSDVQAMSLVSFNSAAISIGRAAALSGNFPPVFPDAAVDSTDANGQSIRYWVTDGGTVENRGTPTLYYALRDALKEISPTDSRPLPPLHIIIADVSASPGKYAESFGLSAVSAGGGEMALGIEAEIRRDIENRYRALGSHAVVHELDMPDVLRSGIGTHWLLPQTMTFTEPKPATDTRTPEKITLDRDDVMTLVKALHTSIHLSRRTQKDACKVLEWESRPTRFPHATTWSTLLKELDPTSVFAPAACQSN